MFWRTRIESKQVYILKIRNPIHITRASIDYTNPADSNISLYISHQGQLHKICTFSKEERENCIVRLDLKFDSKHDEVKIFLDGLGTVDLSGSETLSDISRPNELVKRALKSEDIAATCRDKFLKRKAEYLPKDGKTKQIRNNI